MEKERAANEAQRNASTAKVHNLSCKRGPRDSFLIATRNNCNQAQTDQPTRSPNKMLHRKTPLQKCSSFTPNTLQQIPSPSTIQLNVPLQKGLNKQRVKSLGRWDLNTHVGGLFRKGKCPLSKGPLPLFVFKVLEDSTNCNPTPIGFPPPRIKKSARDVSLRHLSSCRSSHRCHFASQQTTASAESCSARRPLHLRHLSTPNAHTP